MIFVVIIVEFWPISAVMVRIGHLGGKMRHTGGRPKVIAHRGVSGHAPEITLEAYRQAAALGCDGVETDVQMLGDGTLIAFHDPDVKRTTDGIGMLSEYTLESIRKLDAGSWFNRTFPEKARAEYVGLQVPTLQEILELLKASPLELLLEIKSPELYQPDFEERIIACVEMNQFINRTMFMSFSMPSIRKIKLLRPTARTALLVCQMEPDPIEAALNAGADELGILHKLATPELVESARKYGMAFSVWTPDEPADFQHMIDLGVDCITSNYPDRLLQLLADTWH